MPVKRPASTKRRVWRITEAAPLGEIVDPDRPVPKTKTAGEPTQTGWTISSIELKGGVEVNDGPDTVPDDLFEELFKKPR